MTLQPPEGLRSPERLLLFGDAGVGKSHAWLSIVRTLVRYGWEGRAWVMDSDFSVGRMIDEEFPEVAEHVELWETSDWDEMVEAGAEIRKNAQRGDWVVVEMIDNPWVEIRNWWIENVHGQDIQGYFAETRRTMLAENSRGERGFGGVSGLDWDFITKTYLKWEKPLTLKSRAHVIVTTSESKLDSRNTEGEQAEWRIAAGYKPYGQKHLKHRVHTVLRLSQTRHGREMSCVKDRGREEYWAEHGGRGMTLPIERDFARDWLRKVAGWRRQ